MNSSLFRDFFPLWNNFDPYTYRGDKQRRNRMNVGTQQTQKRNKRRKHLIPDKARRREGNIGSGGMTQTHTATRYAQEKNVFVKPNEQNRACSSYAMERKRRMESNYSIVPWDTSAMSCAKRGTRFNTSGLPTKSVFSRARVKATLSLRSIT